MLVRKLLTILGDSLIIALVPIMLVVVIEHETFAGAVAQTTKLFLIPAFFFGCVLLVVVSQWFAGA